MATDPILQARQALREGQAARAIEVLQRSLQRDPGNADAIVFLSMLLARSGQHQRALYFAERAAAASPDSHAPFLAQASILHALGRREDSLSSLSKASSLATSAAALLEVARLAWTTGQITLALDAAERAMRVDPQAARGPYSSYLLHAGEVGQAVDLLRAELAKDAGALDVLLNLAQALNYWHDTTPEEIFDIHRRLGAAYSSRARPAGPPPASRDPNRRLRIGLVSPDFYTTSVAYFAEPIIQHLDRTGRGFEVLCYSSCPRADATTARIHSLADVWRDTSTLAPAAVLQQLEIDRLDILVDLAGATSGHILPLLAQRPAPVQVTAIGYPNTTGLPQVDYRIVDAITDPEGSLAVEHLIRLPGCFLCYKPPPDAPPTAPSPTAAPITFGSLNNAHKLSPPTIDAWTRIVNGTPRSRLLLKSSQFFSPDIRAAYTARFAAAGLDPSRLELLPPTPSLTDHLSTYHRIDIALDPFPYNGTTTTCESLFMGVPMVTLRGNVHAARVGASLLSAVGLPELIASTTDEYIATAAALAADTGRRNELRASLRSRLLASRLCDAPAYAAALGDALRQMWTAYCRNASA